MKNHTIHKITTEIMNILEDNKPYMCKVDGIIRVLIFSKSNNQLRDSHCCYDAEFIYLPLTC